MEEWKIRLTSAKVEVEADLGKKGRVKRITGKYMITIPFPP